MKHQFARNACSAILIPAVLVLAGGCSTQQVASSSTQQVQPSSVVESKTIEPSAAVEPNAVEPSPVIEPKAMDALQKMGAFLQTLKAYEVSFKVSKDEVLDSGQKVMVDGTSELTVQTT